MNLFLSHMFARLLCRPVFSPTVVHTGFCSERAGEDVSHLHPSSSHDDVNKAETPAVRNESILSIAFHLKGTSLTSNFK